MSARVLEHRRQVITPVRDVARKMLMIIGPIPEHFIAASVGCGRIPGIVRKILAGSVVFSAVASCAFTQAAQTITLAWDANPEPDIAGYELYYGPVNRGHTNSIAIAGSSTTATVSSLVPGQAYFFFVTARNVFGSESGPSNEISYTAPRPATNTAPVADDATIQAQEDELVPITLSGNDADGDLIVHRVLSGPLYGTLSGEPPDLTYTPAVNFYGTDSFHYEVSDGISNSAPATVIITVNPINDAPTVDVIPSQIVSTNAGQQTLALTGIGTGAENETATLMVTAVSDAPDLIPNPTVTYASPGSTGELAFSPAADASGSATITVTVDDGQAENGAFSRSFVVVVGINSTPTVYMQAEFASISSPMIIATDTNAANGQYVYSEVSQQGTITFPVDVPQSDDYVIWCRVLSETGGSDSFFVSVDGGAEDIYDTSDDIWSPNWQWTQVNGRALGGPRILTLSQGPHNLVFRGREASTRLDAIYITTDPNFVPPDKTVNPPAPPRLLAPTISSASAMTIKFQAPSESRYEIQVSEDFLWWSPLWQSPPATEDEWIEFVDSDVTASGCRFYRILVLTE